MMKKKFLYAIVLIALVFSSCEKTKKLDITLTEDNSGSVSVTLLDDNEAPLEGVSMELIYRLDNGSSSAFYDVISEEKSNDKGKVTFDIVLPGVYYVSGKDIDVDGKKYNVVKPVMVASGKSTDVIIKPTDYSGKAELKVIANSSGRDSLTVGATVGLIPYDDVYSNATFNELQSVILMDDVVNLDGMVKFENIPVGVYMFLVYYSNQRYDMAEKIMYLSKDEEYKGVISVNYNDLFGY